MNISIMRRRNLLVLLAVAVAAAATMLTFNGVASGDSSNQPRNNGLRYEVSITNITKGQIISPAVVATHRSSLDPIYTLGEPASDELAMVAEDAVLDPFIALLEGDSDVADVEVLTGENGPILPGETATVRITSNGRARELSLAAMLVTTNDTFIALNGVSLPVWRTASHVSPGYDAGSEANNEDCDYIPGPPCGNGGVRDTEGAEGYVYVGNGVHGIADLDPAEHDWRNPVARITIERVRGN